MDRSRTAGAVAGLIGSVAIAGAIAAGTAFARARDREGREDDAPRRARRGGEGEYDVTGRSVLIDRPRAELYAYWRDFQNLAGFMENLERIEDRGDTSVWVIKAPAGQSVEVETRVTADVEGERIGWASVEGSDIDTNGEVTFKDAPGDRGTYVTLEVRYDPPAGELGRLDRQGLHARAARAGPS